MGLDPSPNSPHALKLSGVVTCHRSTLSATADHADALRASAIFHLIGGLLSATATTKFGERAFSHAGPSAWNALPDNIRSVAAKFRKLLKS